MLRRRYSAAALSSECGSMPAAFSSECDLMPVAFSSERSVNKPAHGAGGRIDPVAEAEEPVTAARLGLDLIIVADGEMGFAFNPALAPPFALQSFGSVALRDPVAFAAPDEEARRIIGKQGDDIDRFGPREHTRRARPVAPALACLGRERGEGGDRALGHRARSRRRALERALPE